VLALRGLARSELIRLMSISRCNWYPRFEPEEASTTSSSGFIERRILHILLSRAARHRAQRDGGQGSLCG
jgi:hypothetical protein